MMAKRAASRSRPKTTPKTKARVPALRGTPYTRWTITGVSPETRTAVRKAAHKEGQSIGTWTDKVLHAAATETLKGGSPLLTMPPELLASLDEMSQKIGRLEAQLGQSASSISTANFEQITDDFQKRATQLFDQMQKSTSRVATNVVEHSDSTINQVREIGSATLERIKEATDAALENIRQIAEPKSDDDRNTDELKKD